MKLRGFHNCGSFPAPQQQTVVLGKDWSDDCICLGSKQILDWPEWSEKKLWILPK